LRRPAVRRAGQQGRRQPEERTAVDRGSSPQPSILATRLPECVTEQHPGRVEGEKKGDHCGRHRDAPGRGAESDADHDERHNEEGHLEREPEPPRRVRLRQVDSGRNRRGDHLSAGDAQRKPWNTAACSRILQQRHDRHLLLSPLDDAGHPLGMGRRSCGRLSGDSDHRLDLDIEARLPCNLAAVSEQDLGRRNGPGPVRVSWPAAGTHASGELRPTLDQMILSSFSVSSYGPNISSRPTWYRAHPKPSTRIGPVTRNF
jgi:hypothetical protein